MKILSIFKLIGVPLGAPQSLNLRNLLCHKVGTLYKAHGHRVLDYDYVVFMPSVIMTTTFFLVLSFNRFSMVLLLQSCKFRPPAYRHLL